MAMMGSRVVVLMLVWMALAGCGEEPAVRVYETTRPAAYAWPRTAERTAEHKVDGLTWAWDVPEGFVDAPEVPDQLIADYRFKGASEELPGRLTVSMIPGEAGGVMANIKRWQSQLFVSGEVKTFGPNDMISPPFSSGNLELTLVRLTGQYQGPYVATDLLGAIIRVSSIDGRVVQTWFFKMLGDAPSIDAQTYAFQRICNSFRIADVDPSNLPKPLLGRPDAVHGGAGQDQRGVAEDDDTLPPDVPVPLAPVRPSKPDDAGGAVEGVQP